MGAGWPILTCQDRYTTRVDIGFFGKTVLFGYGFAAAIFAFLGGEHWTDTLLFRFNLQSLTILTGLRSCDTKRRDPRPCLAMRACVRHKSIVSLSTNFLRKMQGDLASTVEA
jgi:hypothetical protein